MTQGKTKTSFLSLFTTKLIGNKEKYRSLPARTNHDSSHIDNDQFSITCKPCNIGYTMDTEQMRNDEIDRCFFNRKIMFKYLLLLIQVLAVLAVVVIIYIGAHVHNYPAYFVLPEEQLHAVNFNYTQINSIRNRYEKHLHILNGRHRTLYEIFELRNEQFENIKTYFTIDVKVDTQHIFLQPSLELFSLKTFFFKDDSQSRINHSNWNIKLVAAWCRSYRDKLAICIKDVSNEKDILVSTRTVTEIKELEKETITFLFMIDNTCNKHFLQLYAYNTVFKEIQFLQYEKKKNKASVAFSMEYLHEQKFIKPSIRSGSDILIKDLPKTDVGNSIALFCKILPKLFDLRFMNRYRDL